MKNIDKKTVNSFSNEWSRFNQDSLSIHESKDIFDKYFNIYPLKKLKKNFEIFDMGCGTGRWAFHLAPLVKKINCIDPSSAIIEAKKNLAKFNNIYYFNTSIDELNLAHNSQDFGYSLGVLHHIPDTSKALKSCNNLLKPGAPFLCYLYYNFDNKPKWFKFLWAISNILRNLIIKLPNSFKNIITDILAIFLYYPLSRSAFILEKMKFDTTNFPLSFYKNKSFYTMRTDSRDRFGTPLEKRFTKDQIKKMMIEAGFKNISFSDKEPFWCCLGFKK